MRSRIFCFWILALAIVVQLVDYSQSNSLSNKVRSHFTVELQKNRTIKISTINKENDFTAMFDLGNNVLWVHKTLFGSNSTWNSEFIYIPSGESLKVVVNNWDADDLAKRQYTLHANNGKKAQFKGNEISTKAVSLIPFIKENYSHAFVDGLILLKEIPLKRPDILPLYDFVPLFGFAVMDELQTTLKNGMPDATTKRIPRKIMTVDCEFDAKFGFPCGKNEIPKGNTHIIPAN